MLNRTETIASWMQQIQKAVEARVKRDLNPIEKDIMDWICFDGFEDMHDLQITQLFDKYGFELPDAYVDEICNAHQNYSDMDINDPIYHGMKKYFRAEFFDVFVDEFSDLDIKLEFELTINTKKGGDYYAMVYFPLRDLCSGIHEVDDIDEEEWSERIRNATGLDVSNCNLYQIHEE